MYNIVNQPSHPSTYSAWRVCYSCGCINQPDAVFCAKGCGYITHIAPVSRAPVLVNADIMVCPQCNAWYACGWPSQVATTICRTCNIFLQKIVARQYPPPFIQQQKRMPCPKCSGKKLQTTFCDHCGRLIHLKVPYMATDTPHVALFTIRYGSQSLRCPFLLDTGAQLGNVLKGCYAYMLGVDLTNAPPHPIEGIASGIVTAYRAEIEIALGNKYYRIPVSFCFMLNPNAWNMLGIRGFFDRFTPRFLKDGVELEEDEILHTQTYKYCPCCGIEVKDAYSNYCYSCGSDLKVEPILNSDLLPQVQQQAKIIPIQNYQLT